MKNTIPKIGIIGGGAAGMMAAAQILESTADTEILIFDKNDKLGSKVIISGGGRCNVTTGITDQKILLQKYTRGSNFLRAALSKFPPQKVYQWFEDHGVPLKTEADNRVFPVSNDGHDVVGAFEKLFNQSNVTLHLQSKVTNVTKNKDRFIIHSQKDDFEVDYLIITTGGNAYRHTGSTGDGYQFAQTLGHTITQLGSSLNSFLVKEEWVKELSGISLPDAQLEYKKNKVHGPFLFTHFGISGPVTFSLSSHLAHEEISKQSPIEISLIPLPGKDFSFWEKEFDQSNPANAKKLVKTALKEYLPQRFVQTILSLAGIRMESKIVNITRPQRQKLSHLLGDGLTITLLQRRPGDEFVTAGGVATEEVNPQTMESKITSHVYFAGEVLDIDGLTGGFNLQSSWATGYVAGKSIAKILIKNK